MLIPHDTHEEMLDLPLDVVAQNLVENLHLRWNYGLVEVEEYTGDDDRAVCVVQGVCVVSEWVMIMVRLLAVDPERTQVIIKCARPNTSGYPFNRPDHVNNAGYRALPATGQTLEDD